MKEIKKYIAIVCVNTVLFLVFNMATAGIPVYVSTLDNNQVSTGLTTTIAAVAALAIRPLAGNVLDKNNKSNALIVGMALMTVPLFVSLLFKNVYLILVMRIFQGMGWGLASTACSVLIANSAPKNKVSEYIGYAGLVSSIATAFAPVIALVVFEKKGAETMLELMGICMLITIIIFLCFRKIYFANSVKKSTTINRVFEKRAIGSAVIIFFVTVSYSPIVTFISQYGSALRIKNISLFFAVYACATIVIRPIAGRYVDRKGYVFPCYIAMVGALGSLLFLWSADNIVSFCVAGGIAGISMGIGTNSLQSLAIVKSELQKRGVAVSTFLFGFDLGMACGSFLSGFLSAWGGYKCMYGIMAIFPIVGIVIVMIVNKNGYLEAKIEHND